MELLEEFKSEILKKFEGIVGINREYLRRPKYANVGGKYAKYVGDICWLYFLYIKCHLNDGIFSKIFGNTLLKFPLVKRPCFLVKYITR